MKSWNSLLLTEDGHIMKPIKKNEKYGMLNMLNTEIYAIVPLKKQKHIFDDIYIEGNSWQEKAVFFNTRTECFNTWDKLTNETQSEESKTFENLSANNEKNFNQLIKK